jgi:muramoyltetrapeptide carboxypeptidase
MTTLTLFSPSGVVPAAPPLRLALKRLRAMGFDASPDADALARAQRFAGDDTTRLAALHRVAQQAPGIAMATRGGYGLTRLLDGINWPLLLKSVEAGTRWVGHSDFTALQLGLMKRGGAGTAGTTGITTWAGPMAIDDFSQADADGGVDDVTQACFTEAMSGELEAVGFKTESGFDGLGVRGTLWGGNLTMVCSVLGTPHWPTVKGGVLFLEDVNVHPFRLERYLLQLHQAGVLAAQKAIVLGAFTAYKPTPLDRGYTLKTVVAHLRGVLKVPVLTGLPFGHVHPKVTLPVGRKVQLVVQGRDALLGW